MSPEPAGSANPDCVLPAFRKDLANTATRLWVPAFRANGTVLWKSLISSVALANSSGHNALNGVPLGIELSDNTRR